MKTVTVHGRRFRLALSEEQIRASVMKLARRIDQEYSDKDPIFIAVLNGSFLFAADLLRELRGECEISFIRVSSYEGTSTTGVITEVLGLTEKIEGRHVIVLEDIVDTGNTIVKLNEQLRKLNPASLKFGTLLFKPLAYKKDITIDYIGMEVGNEFLIGYGLDYDGKARNLKDIYVLDEE
jgi:hypoxanthine phosphoribosyltransferase